MLKPCTVLDKLYLLVCAAKIEQFFLDKELCSKAGLNLAGHASFSERKIVNVYVRQGKLDKWLHSMTQARRNWGGGLQPPQ